MSVTPASGAPHVCTAGKVIDPTGCSNASPVRIRNTADLTPPSVTVPAEPLSGASPANVSVGTVGSQVVNAPGTALNVKIVNSTDKELVTMCSHSGATVVLTYDLTVAPPALVSAWDLSANVAYTDPLSALVQCKSGDLVYGEAIDYCAGGVNFTRVDVIDPTTNTVTGSIWQDDTGAIVPAPTAPSKGLCPVTPAAPTPIRTYLTKNTGVLSLVDIVTATSATSILSVTILQRLGNGVVTPDSPGNFDIMQGESYSWSGDTSVHDLIGSALVFDSTAIGSEQVISVLYTI